MITGDNPLTASHVARDVEIVDREVMILDLREGASTEEDLVWRTVDDRKVIPVLPEEPLDLSILRDYDICMTGAALKQFASLPAWQQLVQHTWVYARVSPAQKEFILTTLRQLGYTTLMAGDGTNDVGALKQAHVGVALLNGTEDDLKKIAEHQKIERFKKVYESQLRLSQRFNAPPPPVPPALAEHFPDIVAAQKKAKEDHTAAKKADPYQKVSMGQYAFVEAFVLRSADHWPCSSTSRRSRPSSPRWMTTTSLHRLSLATLLSQLPSPQNWQTCRLVRGRHQAS